MSELFADSGLRTAAIAAAVICVVSLLIMAAMIGEYKHIHSKRVALLEALENDDSVSHSLKERHVLIVLYVVGTAMSFGLTFWYFSSML